MENIYDLIIIGSGPAGLAAGLYGSRAKMKTLIIEKEKNGGQIVTTHSVENYPGSPEEESGPSLVARMVKQCENFGTESLRKTVTDVRLEGKIKEVICGEEVFQAKAVIIATGASPKKLGCPGEKMFTGKGVSYCATCDADFFEDMEVFVVGGGDSAVEEAMYLTKYARKVTIVHRRDTFTCNRVSLDKAKDNEKIFWRTNSEVVEIKGDGILESIVFKNRETGELDEYFADEEDGTMGLFVFVGLDALTELFVGKINMDDRNYILTDVEMRTNIEGVFAAGDCRQKSLRQVVTATADGAIAAVNAEKYIDENF